MDVEIDGVVVLMLSGVVEDRGGGVSVAGSNSQPISLQWSSKCWSTSNDSFPMLTKLASCSVNLGQVEPTASFGVGVLILSKFLNTFCAFYWSIFCRVILFKSLPKCSKIRPVVNHSGTNFIVFSVKKS